jgi:putative colanic acid biosynthesis glycosyltransferase
MNKGLGMVNGDTVLFMNSGDLFNPDFKFDLFYQWALDHKVILEVNPVISDNYVCIDDFYIIRKLNIENKEWYLKKLPSHQAVFIPKFFYEFNRFDVSLSISSDTQFLLSLFSSEQAIKYDVPISIFFLGGISNNWKSYRQYITHLKEYCKVTGGSFNKKIMKGSVKYFVMKALGFKNYYKLMFRFKLKL